MTQYQTDAKGIKLISYSNKKIWPNEKYGHFPDDFPLFSFIKWQISSVPK
jgi:hypothetical protein